MDFLSTSQWRQSPNRRWHWYHLDLSLISACGSQHVKPDRTGRILLPAGDGNLCGTCGRMYRKELMKSLRKKKMLSRRDAADNV